MIPPSVLLDLTGWKLTLPIGKPGKPIEVLANGLPGFLDTEYFAGRDDGGVRFRAPVTGVTTSGSRNPRSELREMTPEGGKAAWSSRAGGHQLVVVAAVTRLPNPRTDGGDAGVVVAQIHDADDDISVFRVEAGKVWVTKGDDAHFALADGDYALGTRFEARFIVWKGHTQAYYNGKLVTEVTGAYTGAYFKAGCYTQANIDNSRPADRTNYGEAVLYALDVRHTVGQPEWAPDPPPKPPIPPAPPVEPPWTPAPPVEPPWTPAPPPPPPAKPSWLDRLLDWLYKIGGGRKP